MLNVVDVIKKELLFGDLEIICLTESRMIEWKKTWNKSFLKINTEELLKKVLNYKIHSFYYTDTDIVLLWIILDPQDNFLISQNQCFFIQKLDFFKFIDRLKLIDKKNNWLNEGF